MAQTCQITGKRLQFGNNVSHSNRKSRRTFNPNLHVKKFYLPEFDKWITLKVSSAGIRNINKKGLEVCLKEALDKGYL